MATMMVDKIRAKLLALLAPRSCHWCRAILERGSACASCVAALPWNANACRACALPLTRAGETSVCSDCLRDSPPQDRSWAAFRYESPIRQAIVELKFRGRLAPAHVVGGLMAEQLARRAAPLPEVLVPMPLYVRRLQRRGYNQAVELGRELARRLSLPLASRAARRVRATLEQTRLDGAARRRNVRGAFLVDPRSVRGRHVALLDDVITTGATVAELARATRAAGATHIEVWAAARVA